MMIPRNQITRFALIATATVAATIAVAACSTSTPGAGVLRIAGVERPDRIAVDAAGNVYVLDNSGFGRVVKLAAG